MASSDSETLSGRFLIASCIILFILLLLRPRRKLPSNSPQLVGEVWPIVGAIRFFTARWDFHRENAHRSATGNFSYYVGRLPVIGLNGDESRKVFYNTKGLGLMEGYMGLFAAAPTDLKQGVSRTMIEGKEVHGFGQLMSNITNAKALDSLLPHLLVDMRKSMDMLSQRQTRVVEPFESIYRVVFQFSMRAIGVEDIADSPDKLDTARKLFDVLEASSSIATIVFPKVPSFTMLKRAWAGTRLNSMLNRIIRDRVKTGKRGHDPLQLLIDQEYETDRIRHTVINAVFAAKSNTPFNAAWLLVHLAKSPIWLSRVLDEVECAVRKHSRDTSLPLADQLSQIPLQAWESEFPVIEACLRETVRFHVHGMAFRRNISGGDIPIGSSGEIIPEGAYVTYHPADIHLDPQTYKNPKEWDPARFAGARDEDKQSPLGFVGWGTGRSPCIAFWVATFDFELVDRQGNSMDVPKPDPNMLFTKKPVGIFFDCSRK
ncbi:cytochrome P450 6A1 [Phlyctema vagabunda]|uniref:Cytochrome P450 6A1 n=1 Tax=Phlyctema vagabunda TaxID=108571 RepID=A0ABR4PCX8_9HELO